MGALPDGQRRGGVLIQLFGRVLFGHFSLWRQSTFGLYQVGQRNRRNKDVRKEGVVKAFIGLSEPIVIGISLPIFERVDAKKDRIHQQRIGKDIAKANGSISTEE